MKVGTLVRYKHSTTENLGVVVGTSWEHTNCKVTGEIQNTPVYQVQWLAVHPFIKHLKFLRPGSLLEVA